MSRYRMLTNHHTLKVVLILRNIADYLYQLNKKFLFDLANLLFMKGMLNKIFFKTNERSRLDVIIKEPSQNPIMAYNEKL